MIEARRWQNIIRKEIIIYDLSFISFICLVGTGTLLVGFMSSPMQRHPDKRLWRWQKPDQLSICLAVNSAAGGYPFLYLLPFRKLYHHAATLQINWWFHRFSAHFVDYFCYWICLPWDLALFSNQGSNKLMENAWVFEERIHKYVAEYEDNHKGITVVYCS